jgi:hypothetical protein
MLLPLLDEVNDVATVWPRRQQDGSRSDAAGDAAAGFDDHNDRKALIPGSRI